MILAKKTINPIALDKIALHVLIIEKMRDGLDAHIYLILVNLDIKQINNLLLIVTLVLMDIVKMEQKDVFY
jgi:hypothetical protein